MDVHYSKRYPNMDFFRSAIYQGFGYRLHRLLLPIVIRSDEMEIKRMAKGNGIEDRRSVDTWIIEQKT